MIKPKALNPGDTIAIVAPASPPAKIELEQGLKRLQRMGFRIRHHPQIHQAKGYLAGDDETRSSQINQYFADPEIKAIFCARGGYGSLRLLDKLDPLLIQKNPKIFMGYSDITSLLLYLQARCSLVVFHGPMVATDLNRRLSPSVERHLLRVLSTPEGIGEMRPSGIKVLKPGSARGILTGGCLSLITLSIGTPWEIETEGKILFLEDSGEPAYRIDRMLSYLRLLGKFDKIRGLILGRGIQHGPGGREVSRLLLEIFKERSLPIIYNFPAGHSRPNYVLPFGIVIRLDADEGKIIFEEGAVV